LLHTHSFPIGAGEDGASTNTARPM
jgi:hypothetical protein